jgi:tetratricopeptide (TPR) repeat protein
VRKKDLAGAAAALEAMRGPTADDAEVILRLAEVRRLQGDQAKAILVLRDALEKNPAAKILYVPLATLYLQVGDSKAAKETLEKGRAQGADPATVALTLGTTLGRLDESEAALKEFDTAKAAGADPAVVLYNRALGAGPAETARGIGRGARGGRRGEARVGRRSARARARDPRRRSARTRADRARPRHAGQGGGRAARGLARPGVDRRRLAPAGRLRRRR